MDAHGGHESAYPRPATAWWGVALFSLGAILSSLYAVAMWHASDLRAPSQSLP